MKNENQLSNQTSKPKKFIFSNIEESSGTDDWSSSDESSGFCVPILNCSSSTNRTAAIILVAIFIFCFCCFFQIHQCRDNNEELDKLASSNYRWFLQKKHFEQNGDIYL
jgi:hypothetical protein